MRRPQHAVATTLGAMVEIDDPDLHMTTNHHDAAVLDTVVAVDDQSHDEHTTIPVMEMQET
jgi:hypothetical protein